MANPVYEYVTKRILAVLDEGVIPWRRPWKLSEAPRNLISNCPYHGINVFLLSLTDYRAPFWLTWNQIKRKGGFVRKGEKSTMITYSKVENCTEDGQVVTDSNGQPKKSVVFRYYLVWNVEQCNGIPYEMPQQIDHDPIETCESVVAGFVDAPPVTHKGDRAYYRHADDTITMPAMGTFDKAAEYYSTLFHEFAHSTGHKSRIGRDLTGGFGSRSYSLEELTAEMTAAFLCGAAGIDVKTIENSAAYLQSWRSRLSNDHQLIVQAASKAQKAADYIQGKKESERETNGDKSVAQAQGKRQR